MIIDVAVENLIQYAKSHLLLDELDELYVRNRVLDMLKVDSYTQYEIDEDAIDALNCPDTVIAPLVSYALSKGVINEGEQDYFATALMGAVSLKPSEIVNTFEDLHAHSPEKAFNFLHDYSIKND